jgi:hypothetical protein
MIPVIVRPAAEADLEDAQAWYEAESPRLSAAFVPTPRESFLATG